MCPLAPVFSDLVVYNTVKITEFQMSTTHADLAQSFRLGVELRNTKITRISLRNNIALNVDDGIMRHKIKPRDKKPSKWPSLPVPQQAS